jgi:hypothetical protein
MTASKNKKYANAYDKYEAGSKKKRTKKKDKVPEGYEKVEVKPAKMPKYYNPNDKSVPMPKYYNPNDKSVPMPKLERKQYIIIPKDRSKIKKF